MREEIAQIETQIAQQRFDWRSCFGSTLLHYAVWAGDDRLVKQCLKLHPEWINQPNQFGQTPLDIQSADGKNLMHLLVYNLRCSRGDDVFLGEELFKKMWQQEKIRELFFEESFYDEQYDSNISPYQVLLKYYQLNRARAIEKERIGAETRERNRMHNEKLLLRRTTDAKFKEKHEELKASRASSEVPSEEIAEETGLFSFSEIDVPEIDEDEQNKIDIILETEEAEFIQQQSWETGDVEEGKEFDQPVAEKKTEENQKEKEDEPVDSQQRKHKGYLKKIENIIRETFAVQDETKESVQGVRASAPFVEVIERGFRSELTAAIKRRKNRKKKKKKELPLPSEQQSFLCGQMHRLQNELLALEKKKQMVGNLFSELASYLNRLLQECSGNDYATAKERMDGVQKTQYLLLSSTQEFSKEAEKYLGPLMRLHCMTKNRHFWHITATHSVTLLKTAQEKILSSPVPVEETGVPKSEVDESSAAAVATEILRCQTEIQQRQEEIKKMKQHDQVDKLFRDLKKRLSEKLKSTMISVQTKETLQRRLDAISQCQTALKKAGTEDNIRTAFNELKANTSVTQKMHPCWDAFCAFLSRKEQKTQTLCDVETAEVEARTLLSS